MARSSNLKTRIVSPALFLTCEHAGNEIPARYKKLFAKSRGVLATHRGWDPGAYEVASELKRLSSAPLLHTKLSRLVVDMNRSLGSETLLSKWTSSLDKSDQDALLKKYYVPYRNSIETAVAKLLKKSPVVHVGIHSFSPNLDPARRSCQIGVLFDPKSRFETAVADHLFDQLKVLFPNLGIRKNYPYRGDGDGVTTDLRNKYRSQKQKNAYAGFEIEFNQAFLKKLQKQKSLKSFTKLFYFALESALVVNVPIAN